jgi:hypothetical protein
MICIFGDTVSHNSIQLWLLVAKWYAGMPIAHTTAKGIGCMQVG